MKIVHLCLNGPVTDGFNYQDNLLTKYQKKLGHDVIIITSEWICTSDGKMKKDIRKDYVNDDEVRLIRIPIKGKDDFSNKFKTYHCLYETIELLSPEILFIHGVSSRTNYTVVKYIKTHQNVIVFADNHADLHNSASNWISKNILHKIIWRHYAQMLTPYVKKFYGVLPARVDFLKEVYKLPGDKCELLVMGADDELIDSVKNPKAREFTRKQYGIEDNEFLIVTGGKINKFRPETLELISAVVESKLEKIKLLIFGSVDENLKVKFEELCINKKIQFVGWQSAEGTYRLMNAGDLVVFPGLHSVLWEQAVAIGVPCVFRDIEGFHHVDIGGNAIFLKEVTKESMKKTIESLYLDTDKYKRMHFAANEKGIEKFSYKNISRRSIE